MEIIDGKKLAKEIRESLKIKCDELKKEGIEPVTYIIGDDKRSPDYTEKLKKTIKENGMEGYVHLTGRINDETKENIMHNSGIFVFPSLCEGYGMVVLETMKYGIPAVVFNNTNLPYIVHDGFDGFVVENKNWKAMKEKMVRKRSAPTIPNTAPLAPTDILSVCFIQSHATDKTDPPSPLTTYKTIKNKCPQTLSIISPAR